jgi:hypothetical protein
MQEIQLQFQERQQIDVLQLPQMVGDVIRNFDTPLQQKMALASTVTIIGSLLPKIHFSYENGKNHSSLYTVIVLPPASGKGSTGKIEIVLRKIIEEQHKEIKRVKANYKREMRQYDREVRENPNAKPPDKPSYPLLKIPGNITSAKFIEQLAENNGEMFALIFETEIDGITNMMGSAQFGKDNSMILRKAYHNESVSIMRKSGDHYEISSPKLSIVLTGTPSQLNGLFQSVEDGLYSRFLIVNGSVPLLWKDVQPCDSCTPIEVKLERLADDFHAFYLKMKDLELEFKLTDEQWRRINDFGENRLKTSFDIGGEYATSVAKRHALMIARIACILSMMRYYTNGDSAGVFICEDRDFETALSMVTESFDCSMEIFLSLKKQKDKEGDSKMMELFERMPTRFKTNELSPLVKSLRISDRTMYRHLEELVKIGKLTSPSKGYYEKNTMADMADGSNYLPYAPEAQIWGLNQDI